MQLKRSFTLPGVRGNAVRAEVANYFLNAGYTQTSEIPLRFARSSGKRSKVTVEVSTEAEATAVNTTFDVFGPDFLMREQERRYWRDEADRFASEIGVKMGLPPTFQPVSDEQRAKEDLKAARDKVFIGLTMVVTSMVTSVGMMFIFGSSGAGTGLSAAGAAFFVVYIPGLVKTWKIKARPGERYKLIGGSLAVLVVVGVGTFFAYGAIAASQNQWKQFTSQEGAFSVLMPGVPKEKTATANSAAGPLEIQQFNLERDGITYAVWYVDYPASVMRGADPNKMLDASRDGGVSSSQGKLLSELIISIDGYPGRDLRIEMAGGKMTTRIRIFLVKDRLYQLIAVTTKEKALSTSISKFFDSFKLTGP